MTEPTVVILIAALVLAATAAADLLHRSYLKHVRATMRKGGRGGGPVPVAAEPARRREPLPPPPEIDVRPDVWRRPPPLTARAAAWARYARRAHFWTVTIYAAAAAAHLYTTALVLSHAVEHSPPAALPVSTGPWMKWLTLLLFLCPLGMTVGAATLASTRVRLSASALYGLAWAWLVSEAVPPGGRSWSAISGELWMLLGAVLVPAVVKAFVMNRRLKSAGTLTLMFLGSGAVGSLAAFWLTRRLGAGTALSITLGICALACGLWIGWWFVADTARRYRRKASSDQTIVLDNYWLLQTESFAVFFTLLYGWRGLLAAAAFVSYVLALKLGFFLREHFLPRRSRGPRLLLLRTFGRPARGRALRRLMDALRLGQHVLFERVAARWRYAGSIQLITGPDLAQETLDPDELVEFVSRELAERAVTSETALRQRVGRLDREPDPDGRFRVNEFLCHDHAWVGAVRELIRQSDAVLLDLRGFTRESGGVVKELGILFELVPVEQLVLVVDGSTDLPQLKAAVAAEWARMSADSPNKDGPPPALRAVSAAWQSWGVAGAITGMLFEAAARPARRRRAAV